MTNVSPLSSIDVVGDSPDAKAVPDSPQLEAVAKLVEEYDLLQADLKILAQRAAVREERVEAILSQLLPAAMEQAGVSSFVTKSGRSVIVDDKVNGNIPALSTIVKEKDPAKKAMLLQRREDALRIIGEKWPGLIKTEVSVQLGRGELDLALKAVKLLREQLDLPASVDQNVHPQTLNSHFKELKEVGRLGEIPTEPFALFIGPYAKIK